MAELEMVEKNTKSMIKELRRIIQNNFLDMYTSKHMT